MRMKHYDKGYIFLHLKRTSQLKGARLIIVDDTIRTGEHMKAAIPLLEKMGAIVVAVACLSEIVECSIPKLQIAVPIISVERIEGLENVIESK
jgi:adenine/guanine phosphoribosyltransferase-like PRPP-binding protein